MADFIVSCRTIPKMLRRLSLAVVALVVLVSAAGAADFIVSGPGPGINLRYKDMGDGTAAAVVALSAPLPPGSVSKTISICVTPSVTTANSYGTNFVVGGLLTFANAFTATGSGILQNVSVTIKDLETSGFTFIPFIANPSNTTWTDAVVAAINAADVTKVRGAVPLAANNQLAATGFSSYYAYGLGHAMAPGAGVTSLWGVLLSNAALTTQFAAASDLQVCVKIIQDP